jgi:hypothetical protein
VRRRDFLRATGTLAAMGPAVAMAMPPWQRRRRQQIAPIAPPQRLALPKWSDAQRRFYESDASVIGFIGAVGIGKTLVAAYRLLRLISRGLHYLVLTPTWRHLRSVLRVLRLAAWRLGRPWREDPAGRYVMVGTAGGGMAKIHLRHNPDKAAWNTGLPVLAGCWVDDAQLMPRNPLPSIFPSAKVPADVQVMVTCGFRDNHWSPYLGATAGHVASLWDWEVVGPGWQIGGKAHD